MSKAAETRSNQEPHPVCDNPNAEEVSEPWRGPPEKPEFWAVYWTPQTGGPAPEKGVLVKGALKTNGTNIQES